MLFDNYDNNQTEIEDIYDGEYVDNIRCGYGIMQYASGNTYEGNWLNNSENGRGVMNYLNGDIYNGSWYNGMRNGNGTIQYYNGSTYEGSFYNDKRNGYGKLVDIQNSYTYEGQWQDDEMYDSGTIYYSNGDTYIGKVSDNTPNGSGRMKFINNDQYSGEWKDGKQCGLGTMTYNKGDVYSGKWNNGLFDGDGIYTYKSGEIYNGTWCKGEKSGMCTVTFCSGDRYIGVWNDYCSNIHSFSNYPPTFIYKNNDIYVGCFSDKKRDGYGIIEYSNGDIYEGFWSNNVYQGTGKYKSVNGEIYTCEWSNGMKNGKGCITYKNGDTYNGFWNKDSMIDDGTYYCKKEDKEYLYIHTNSNNASIWYNDKQVYLGEHKNLIKHGDGEEYEDDGTIFIGKFINGQRDQGVLILKNDNKEKLRYICYYNKEGVPYKILKPSDIQSSESKLFIQFCKIKRERDNLNKEVDGSSKRFKKLVEDLNNANNIMADKDLEINKLQDKLKIKEKQLTTFERFVDTDQSKDIDDIPRVLTCPITLELMTDPVICTDNITYERSAIDNYVKGTKCRSPVNRLYIDPNFIVTNQAVRDMIETWASVCNKKIELKPIQSSGTMSSIPGRGSGPPPPSGRGRGSMIRSTPSDRGSGPPPPSGRGRGSMININNNL